MSALCLMVAEQSLRLSGIILFLWVLRTLLRKIPGSALYLLWILVFTGLLLPFRVEIPYHTEAPAVIAETPHATDAPGEQIGAGAPAAAKPSDTAGTPAAEKPAHTAADLLPLACAVWAAVAAGLLLINGWKLAAFTRHLQGARQIAPGVYETDRVEVPLVMGYLRPKIYLPSFLREEEREYILLHERIHLRRRDYLIKPAAFAITLLHWFNPLV